MCGGGKHLDRPVQSDLSTKNEVEIELDHRDISQQLCTVVHKCALSTGHVNSASPNYLALRRALSLRRAELGLTYEALAEAAGLSRTGVINLELGNRLGSLPTWFAVAKALDLPFSQLMEHLEDPANG